MRHQHDAGIAGLTRDPGSENLGRRIVLIGTIQTLAGLAPQFMFGKGIATPVGAVLINPASDGDPRNPSEECVAASACRPTAVCGLTILGDLEALTRLHAINPVSLAVVSFEGADHAAAETVLSRLRDLDIPFRAVTPLADLIAGIAPQPRRTRLAVDLTELIGRTPYGIDHATVSDVLTGKRVLITGAGGSIGSELCRIAATFDPACILMMERSENALFEVDRQLARRFPTVRRKAILHDVTDTEQTLREFVTHKPQVVFHAAAHKHVPLMEDHPAHAVTNNLFGTKSVADASLAVATERFVMISSDKAVNPTSVMGATKRLAEMYVQSLSRTTANRRTSFSMVRFGNVLGSACSVLPIWEAQLTEGGPITVTDDRMTRYFMTIHEAAALVIQAAAIACPGGASPSIYVLDMGEPVRILDLAQKFVAMHGFEGQVVGPAVLEGASASCSRCRLPTMQIAITGIRPGEKLHEELAYHAESLSATRFPGIRALKASARADFDAASMIAELSVVRGCQDRGVVLAAIRRHVREMVISNASLAMERSESTNTDQSPYNLAPWAAAAA